VDITSIIKEAVSDLNQCIAERVRELRAAQGLSLDALASKSSVSHSMISHFPPGKRVAFETGGRDTRVHQQVWVLEGGIEITLGVERHRLREGDCLAMQLDRPTIFYNPTRKRARYAVVIASETPSRR